MSKLNRNISIKQSLKYIFIITPAIIIGVTLGYLLFGLVNTNEHKLSTLDDVIREYNTVINVFKKENLSEEDSFQHQYDHGLTCYKYIGTNEDEYINKIKNLFIEPFDHYSHFFLKTTEKQEMLYACKPQNCEIKTFKEYSEINETDEQKKVIIESYECSLQKDGDNWKFPYSIIQCENVN